MKTLEEWQKEGLTSAEKELLACCQSGKIEQKRLTSTTEANEIYAILKIRPTEKTENNEIRADFLRWLILTNEVSIDPKGIELKGAWLSGKLDLEHVHCLHVLSFFHSVFEEVLLLRGATTKSIHMNGSLCKKGIDADGLICHGNLNLRKGFESEDEVRFLVARIEGEIDCSNAKFKALNGKENVLSCDGINVEGAVTLANSYFEGTVRFVSAKMRDNFDCTKATFEAFQEEKKALCCDSMTVSGGLILRENCKILKGTLDLSNVTVSALADDKSFWQQESLKEVKLDGFKYSHIYSDDLTAEFRLKEMLAKMLEFKPQPYKQLAKVLRDMGHSREADEVMIALNDERFGTKEEVKKTKVCNFLSWLYIKLKVVWMPIKYFFSYKLSICGLKTSQLLWLLYKWTSEYGYRPMRTLKIMLFVWFVFGCIYWYGANVSVFAPTNPLIFQAPEKYKNCKVDENGTKWLASPKDYNESNNWYIASPSEYTTFQPFWYSLDIILPVVDLKMEKDWGIVIPSPEGSWSDMIPFTTTNHFIRFLTWVESLAGWGLSLMLVAILSGLAKNEKE